jgi:hypothetical protein
MLRSAKIAALARDAGRFGVRIPSVSVDLPAVQQRARDVIDAQSGEGAAPFERAGIRVFMQEAGLTGPHRIELADGTQVEADRVVLTTGTEAAIPPIDGLEDGPFWTNKEAIWKPTEPPRSLAVVGAGAIGIEFAQIYSRFRDAGRGPRGAAAHPPGRGRGSGGRAGARAGRGRGSRSRGGDDPSRAPHVGRVGARSAGEPDPADG